MRAALSQVVRPVVWVLAVLWLVVERTGAATGRGLEAYERGAAAAGRACLRAGRAVLRALGPLGRALRRLADPFLRAVRWVWDQVSVRLLLRMFRPLGRLARRVVALVRPTAERVVAWGRRQVDRLAPMLAALARAVEQVERAAGRLSARLSRTVEPLRRAVRTVRTRLTTRRA